MFITLFRKDLEDGKPPSAGQLKEFRGEGSEEFHASIKKIQEEISSFSKRSVYGMVNDSLRSLLRKTDNPKRTVADYLVKVQQDMKKADEQANVRTGRLVGVHFAKTDQDAEDGAGPTTERETKCGTRPKTIQPTRRD